MEEELDPFEFVLAEALGMTIASVREMANDEYLAWRAFHVWRNEMRELERQSPK